MGDEERRQFVRVPCTVGLNYWLVNTETGGKAGEVIQGETRNIGAGGLLIKGVLPAIESISDLLGHRVVLAGRLALPNDPDPVLLLGRVAWLEDIDPQASTCVLGVMITEIRQADRDRLNQFVIRATML